MSKEVFIWERETCKSTLQRKKRKYLSNILQTAGNDHTLGRIRNFFSHFKQFNPIWSLIRYQDGQMLMERESKAER